MRRRLRGIYLRPRHVALAPGGRPGLSGDEGARERAEIAIKTFRFYSRTRPRGGGARRWIVAREKARTDHLRLFVRRIWEEKLGVDYKRTSGYERIRRKGESSRSCRSLPRFARGM